MATVACQIIRTLSDSGAAADQTTNVLHFDGGTDYATLGQAMLGVFRGNPPGSAPTFSLYQNSASIEVKIYDLADEKPRPERWYGKWTGGGSEGIGPRILCGVLSFYAGRNLPRQRGRIFLGPLTVSDTGSELVPDDVCTQAINLAQGIYQTDGGTWNHVVYSQAAQAPTETMTNYFASNGWGVQHSRALSPSGRQTWAPSS